MFSHLCLLLSLIFTTKANNVFFLFAAKPHKCTTVERLFPALQQSALPLVFYENSEVSTLDSKGTEKKHTCTRCYCQEINNYKHQAIVLKISHLSYPRQ